MCATTVRRYALGALILAGFGLGALPAFLGVLNHDVAWLLHAAGRVLAGDRLYVDVVETNPPLIVWLNLAPVLLARSAGISEVLAFRLLVILLVACSLVLSHRTLRRLWLERPDERRAVLVLALFVLLPLTGYDFGEREHLLFAMILPYLLMACGRAMGRDIGGGLPWIAGCLAGVGIALKPHFVVFWVAVETALAWARRDWRTWLRPESLAVAAVGIVYAVAVATVAPDYLGFVGWAKSLYLFNNGMTFASLIGDSAACVSLLAGLGFILVAPRGHDRECCGVVLVASLSLLSIAVMQYKGYRYHYYPALASAMLLLALLFMASRGLAARRSRIAGVVCAGMLAALVLQAAANRVVESIMWRGRPDRTDTRLGRMARLAKSYARGDHIFTFSPAVLDSFPLVTYSGVGWASRHPCLWFLPALYAEYYADRPTTGYHPMAAMSQTERFLFDSVVDDLLTDPPALLFVDESERKGAFNWQRFDYLGYYSRDPRFADFLRQYEPVARVDAFRVYRRKTDGVRSMAGRARE
jgi:hypothetical protein